MIGASEKSENADKDTKFFDFEKKNYANLCSSEKTFLTDQIITHCVKNHINQITFPFITLKITNQITFCFITFTNYISIYNLNDIQVSKGDANIILFLGYFTF